MSARQMEVSDIQYVCNLWYRFKSPDTIGSKCCGYNAVNQKCPATVGFKICRERTLPHWALHGRPQTNCQQIFKD